MCVGNHIPAPPGHEADTEETQAPDIQRPPRAWEIPEGPLQRQLQPSPRKEQRRALEGGHLAATEQKPQGAVVASPQAPPAADRAWAVRALGPETQGPPVVSLSLTHLYKGYNGSHVILFN